MLIYISTSRFILPNFLHKRKYEKKNQVFYTFYWFVLAWDPKDQVNITAWEWKACGHIRVYVTRVNHRFGLNKTITRPMPDLAYLYHNHTWGNFNHDQPWLHCASRQIGPAKVGKLIPLLISSCFHFSSIPTVWYHSILRFLLNV